MNSLLTKSKSVSIVIKRLIPYLTPLITFIGLEMAFAKPGLGWINLVVIFTIGLISCFYLAKGQLTKKRIRFLLPEVLFLVSFILFFLLLVLSSSVFKHFFALSIVILLGLTLEISFRFFHYQYNLKNFHNFFSYLNLLTVFMFFASFGSANIFLGVNNWLLLIFAAIISLIIFHNNYYILSFLKASDKGDLIQMLNQKIENLVGQNQIQKILFTLIPTLALIEIFWSLSFLPTSFYVNSFILTLGYYLISGLIKNYLTNGLTPKIIQKYFIASGICLLLIIFTARV